MNVTLRVALERIVVESEAPEADPGGNQTSVQRRHFAPTVTTCLPESTKVFGWNGTSVQRKRLAPILKCFWQRTH